MTNKINKIIFIGLIISGSGLILGYILAKFDSLYYLAGILVGSGAYFGMFFGIFALISFVIGTIMFLTGYMENYWHTFYPLNFGLTLLGGSFFQHNSNIHNASLILIALIASFLTSFILYKINAMKTRWLLVILMAPLFLKSDFWTTFVIGIVFVSLSLAEGTIKTILENPGNTMLNS